MKKKEKKLYIQQKRRFLKKIFGTTEKPRLSVFRSHKHIYAQLIDDKTRTSLASSSTLDKTIKSTLSTLATKEASFLVGQMLAQKAILRGIKYVVFDRGTKPYHGRIQSLAEGARQSGLLF
jgi:large subunit ribosomal protein L18